MTTQTYLDEEGRKQTQAELQAILKDMQTAKRPSTPKTPARVTMEAFLDQETIVEMPAMPRTDKLPAPRQKTDFEAWLDPHIFEYHEQHHRYPSVISVSSIRKLEFIVEQLERQEANVRWHEYVFKHTYGWIVIKLETKIMGYSEVECK